MGDDEHALYLKCVMIYLMIRFHSGHDYEPVLHLGRRCVFLFVLRQRVVFRSNDPKRGELKERQQQQRVLQQDYETDRRCCRHRNGSLEIKINA